MGKNGRRKGEKEVFEDSIECSDRIEIGKVINYSFCLGNIGTSTTTGA
jgi:hypothetical protein